MWRLYMFRRRWLVLRLTLRYGGGQCAYCECAFTPTGARQRTIDHITPLSRGGTWRIGNVVFACRSCNMRKGDRDLVDFLWSNWLKRRRLLMNADNLHHNAPVA